MGLALLGLLAAAAPGCASASARSAACTHDSRCVSQIWRCMLTTAQQRRQHAHLLGSLRVRLAARLAGLALWSGRSETLAGLAEQCRASGGRQAGISTADHF